MGYKAFYRTYRPKNFNEVIGQDHIIQTLTNIIRMNKISHGYLFSGPRGTGKTSIAKIFANAINCVHTEFAEQICNLCLNDTNTSLDIIEIDAASNNSVNDVRTIREQINFVPTNHPYKIYIIDEVHMLSKGAFNALLMTLEEPPKHAIFILATTDPDKIPDTILSRVQRYNFKKIAKADLKKQLEFIFHKENIKYDLPSLELIASLANGSLRDALSIADQTNAYSNSDISHDDIIKIFGLATIESQITLINYMVEKNVSDALRYFDDLINSGVDVSKLTICLINLLKDYLIYKKTRNSKLIQSTDEYTIEKLLIKSSYVHKYLEILTPLLQEIKYSEISHQLFQLAIIKLCSFEKELKDINNNKTISSIDKTQPILIEKESFDELQKTKDITGQLFSLEKTKIINNDKTLLSDFSTNEVENRFNLFLDKNNENETRTDNKDTTSDSALESSNSNTDKLIQQTTMVLNIANEENATNLEVNESILDSTKDLDFDKKIIYDTNELSLNDSNREKDKIKNVTNEITSEFKIDEKDEKTLEIEDSDFVESSQFLEYKLTQPNIVNLFVLADKTTFDYFKEKLINASLSVEEEFSIFTTLLKEVKFICSAHNYILVSSNEDWVIDDLNKFNNDHKFAKFVDTFWGVDVYFFAITKKEYENSRNLYIELKKSNNAPKGQKLAKKNNENYYNDLEEENKYKETELKAKTLFGNLFKKKIN